MKYIATLLLCFRITALYSQADPEKIAGTPAKSGTSYEALTQFFQVNLSSEKGGGYDFRATLFGIQKFFSKDSLNASSAYLKKYPARNLEFTVGLHKGSTSNLSLLLGGLKYALVNNRDKSTHNFSHEENGLLAREIALILSARDSALRTYTAEIKGDAAKEKELDAADTRFQKSQNFKEYPQRVQNLYDDYLTKRQRDPKDFLQSIQDIYNRIAKNIEKKGLLALSVYPGYDWNRSRFDTTTINLQYLKGWGNFKKPWNIDIKATQIFQQDTALKDRSLTRRVFVGKLGINKVLVYDGKLNPLIEFELAYEHDYVLDGLYAKEDRNRPKLVNTLRVHITKEIFIPVTLKYDLKNSNLFGVFRLQWDLQTGK